MKLWMNQNRLYTYSFWEGELRAREKIVVGTSEMQQEIEAMIRSVRGDLLPMKYAWLRQRAWDIGTQFADRLAVRNALRPFVGRIRWWF